MKYIVSLYKILVGFTVFVNSYALNQLSFSGAGSFGAVEIGIIHKLQDLYDKKYDLYSGISAGGINAGFLSHFENINDGIIKAIDFYSTSKNKDIYSIRHPTHISLLNTNPLKNTMQNILKELSNPVIDTYIGATNLYTGKLDVFNYHEANSIDECITILMATSAIPLVFPPITYKNSQYADGGTLQNELLNIIHDDSYLNITYITPYMDTIYDNSNITSLIQMTKRSLDIVKNNFNSEFNKINTNCQNIKGEINKYFVNNSLLEPYDMLNFNNGNDLYNIGYHNIQHEKIYIC